MLSKFKDSNEGKGNEGIRPIKLFEFENTRGESQKMLRSLRKKESDMSDKSYIPNGIYLQKLPLLLTLQINKSSNVKFQLEKILLWVIADI